MTTPYETDVYLWSQEQAALLDGRHFDALDIPNLVEEVLDVGKSLYRGTSSALYIILVHLLKWRYQPAKRSISWQNSLVEHRNRVPRNLEDAPALAGELAIMVAREYPRACRKASTQTRLPLATFPTACPWTVAQVLDYDFFPSAISEES